MPPSSQGSKSFRSLTSPRWESACNRTGWRLYIGPDFVLDRSPDELRGVLLHEVHHVLFKHLQSDPSDFPDRWARQVAEEVTANEFITEPLPAGAILLSQFPELPPMESTD